MSWAGDERKRRSEALERLGLRDASLWLGPPEGFPLARELGLKELLGELGAYRIGGGLLSHWWGKTISAQAGNGALKALPADAALGLYTLWTALPLYPVDSGPLPGFGKPDERMKGARLFPKSHNYPLEDWVVGPPCEWLIRYRLPPVPLAHRDGVERRSFSRRAIPPAPRRRREPGEEGHLPHKGALPAHAGAS